MLQVVLYVGRGRVGHVDGHFEVYLVSGGKVERNHFDFRVDLIIFAALLAG